MFISVVCISYYVSTAANRKMKSQRKSYCMTVLNNGTCNHCWANCAKKYFVTIYNDLILQVWTTITSYFLNICFYFVPSGILHVRSSQTSWKTSHLILKTRIFGLWSFQNFCPPNFGQSLQGVSWEFETAGAKHK